MLRRTLASIRTKSCRYGTSQSLSLQNTVFNTKAEVEGVSGRVKELLQPISSVLRELTHYQFNAGGKAVRPLLASLVASAHNSHWLSSSSSSPRETAVPPSVGLLESQRCVATVAEMIHVASLIHDDLIDQSSVRRGQPSVHTAFSPRKAVLAGDFVLARASEALARTCNDEVVRVLAQVIEDLIRGEFMQLGSRETDNERFSHYLKKTYHKTASLMANSCKAMAILSAESMSSDESVQERLIESAFQFGRHVGLAFQLIDDILDYSATEDELGKPAGADLQLGLATGPVLFAAQEYPELNAVIMRRFSEQGDIQLALELVQRSDGVRQSKMMAETHARSALSELSLLGPTCATAELSELVHRLLQRTS